MLSFMLVMFLIGSTLSHAKNAVLEVEYVIDPAYEPFIVEYRLYMEDPSVGDKILLANQPITSTRLWTTPVVDIPPGKPMNYYLSAVYDGGEEFTSIAYPFALRGKPTIFKITRTK